MWTTIILTVIIFYFLYHVDKRLKKLENSGDPGESWSLNIDALNAIIKHPRFGDITGIKSAQEGKAFKDWTEKEQTKCRKEFMEKAQKAHVYLLYLPSAKAYFVSSYYNPRSNGIRLKHSTKNLLYSSIVVGDDDGFGPHLEFLVYERLIKISKDNYEWRLTPCLQYREKFSLGKKDFQILCDFPIFSTATNFDSKAKELGFEVKRWGGDDVYTDSFGEMDSVPTSITYSKNGVEINEVF